MIEDDNYNGRKPDDMLREDEAKPVDTLEYTNNVDEN